MRFIKACFGMLSMAVIAGCSAGDDGVGAAMQGAEQVLVTALPAGVDFGLVPVGTSGSASASLTNISRGPVTFTGVFVYPAGAVRASLGAAGLAGGQSTRVDIAYAPTDSSVYRGAVYATYVDASGRSASVRVTVLGRALTGCSRDVLAMCDPSALPLCADGETPYRKADCCPSCRPQGTTMGCTEQQLQTCNGAVAAGSLPVCAPGQPPVFDTETCCVTCRPAPSGDARPCSRDGVRACLATVPVCGPGELSIVASSACCPQCRRPERTCTPEDVVNCVASTPVCAPGETPATVDGACCPSCRPRT